MKLTFILFLFIPLAQGAILVTEDNLRENLKNSPELQELTNRYNGAKALQGNLLRSFLPTVELIYGRERFTTGPYYKTNQPYGGVEARMNVFNSGRDLLESKKINQKSLISELDTEAAKALLLAELRKSLAHYAYLSEVITILEEALKLNEASFKDAQKRINAGLATRTDLLDFKQQKIQFSQELQNLNYEMGVTKRMVAVLLGENPEDDVVIKYENAHPEHGKEETLTGDVKKNLLVKKARLFKEVAGLESTLARRWWMPSLELYGYALRFTQKEREYQEVGQRNDVTFGFKFTLPVFDGGDSIAQSRAQAALYQAQEKLVLAKELEMKKQTMDAQRKLDLAHGLIHGAEENVEVMEDYRRGIKSEYTKGVKNSPDVLQAGQRWISAREKFAEVKKNYQFAKADALYLMTLAGE